MATILFLDEIKKKLGKTRFICRIQRSCKDRFTGINIISIPITGG